MNSKVIKFGVLFIFASLGLLLFQNCSEPVEFSSSQSQSGPQGDGSEAGAGSANDSTSEDNQFDPLLPLPMNPVEVCEMISCDLNPLTAVPAVTTILMALGDEADSQLVVNGASSQLLAESIIRYTSPKEDPQILLVQDFAHNGESLEDTAFIKDVLLARYQVTFLQESETGITASDLEGFDLVWYNNPGHSMGLASTRDVLLGFSGGVVLQGDDLTRGKDFSLAELTGLEHIDNGTSVVCDGKTYYHDNNTGEQYRVTIDPEKIPGGEASTINFRYGNDIDNSVIIREDLEVLAYALGGPEVCIEARPAIVRYTK